MKNIKYKVNEFFNRDKGQEFSEYEPEYKFDEEKDCPVVVGKINIQEKIQSFENCSLNKILDKYLDADGDLSALSKEVIHDEKSVYRHVKPDLADLAAEYERVEELKERYGLDPALSYQEIINTLVSRKSELDAIIKDYVSKENDKRVKEVIDNEKTQIKKEDK